MEDILNQVLPILTQAVVSVLGILISVIATKAMSYLTAKKAEIVSKIGASQYNFSVAVAESIFYGIEQQMKTASGIEKKNEFNKRIAAKIPGITPEDIDHLREAIVGKTKGLTKIITEQVPVPISPFSVPSLVPVPMPMPWNNPVIHSSNAPATWTTLTTTESDDVIVTPYIDPETPQSFHDEIPDENADKDI